MRRGTAAAAIILIIAVAAGGVFLSQVSVRKTTFTPTQMTNDDALRSLRQAASEAEKARERCQTETQDWRFKECIARIREPSLAFAPLPRSLEFSPDIISRANAGDPEASLQYGYHIVGKAVVDNTEPLDAIPYLMVAALAGDIGAHVQLGLIEAVSRKDGDLIKAWAHFDVALREMSKNAPDYRRSQMHLDEITAKLSQADLNKAKALSLEYAKTTRSNRNALK